jgi:hypothetical protein
MEHRKRPAPSQNPREFGEAKELHRKRHSDLHTAVEELLDDYLAHHPRALASNTSVTELLQWSYGETIAPSDGEHKTGYRYFFGRVW